ncbi:MAG: 50S ribosomal protein L15 [Candidatus Marinimicrobia bacterium]|nr:50S ribosomal protein L15 [Candidatus Neomarinimicrobiota bacterium]MCH7938786.1 50S ribosomal protein L15 [Candidatus Neomarinimicrobiota bacterium]
MRLELKPATGSTRPSKRRGRGPASGLGKTSGRGHKGWHSRSGSKRLAWYEGGQMPLQRRVPKRGFSNAPFSKPVQIVNLEAIARLKLDKVDPEIFKQRGLIQNVKIAVKVLGNGDLETAVEVNAHGFSRSAREKIEKAGGQAVVC